MISGTARMGISRTVQSVFVPTLCARPASAQVPARGMKELEPRVFVVDDDQSVRTRLAKLLAREDYAIEFFASAEEYLVRVPHSGPACIVVEVHLPGLDGLALQRKLTEEGRPERIVFITRRANLPMGIGAMKRGAVDFLPKPFKNEELLSAVALALARSAEVAESRARLAKLTPREFEVFRLVIAGLVNKEIGAELGLTLRTTKAHRARVMQKIGVLSVAELVRLAQKAGVAPAQTGIALKTSNTAHRSVAYTTHQY
jgi:FixJ family two-component response regulator